MESIRMRTPTKALALKLGAGAALLGVIILAIVLTTAGSTAPGRRTTPAPPPPLPPAGTPVSVWVDTRHPGAPVPQEFLGLSFELSSAAQIARYADDGNFVALLRSLGPGVLRFGGASADTRVAWTDAHTPRPAWASSVLDASDLHRLARLAARTRWHILLTVGLAHYDAWAAARETAVAKAALGPWLMGIEVGNEPNSYAAHGLRDAPWNDSTYNAEVSEYRHAIAAITPDIAVAGPGVSGSSAFKRWGPSEALTQKPALLTGHHYPLGCRVPSQSTIPRLLSQYTRGRELQSLRRYKSISRASAIPLRIDETNSVSCGGKKGVSNTFAAALWAVQYIAQTMAVGAAGINFQGAPANCEGYSPVCAPNQARLLRGALRPQPEWYALLLTRGLVGNRPVHTTIVSRPHTRPNVAVTALRGPHGALRFAIVDDDPPGSQPVALSLHVGGGYQMANVMRLTAPSPRATAGVRLAGAAVRPDGSWRGPSRLPRLAIRGGVAALTIAPSSAALVTVAPRSAPPTHTCAHTTCASGEPPRGGAHRRRVVKPA